MIITLTLSHRSLPGLDVALTGLGVEVRRRPLLGFAPRNSEALQALTGDRRFGAIVVTSPRAAAVLRSVIGELEPARAAGLPPVWAVGPQTRSQLPDSLECRLPDSGAGAVPLASAMIAAGVSGPVLYLCSAERRNELPDRLRSNGIEVTEMTVYDVELAEPSVVREALGGTDLVLIGSHRVLHAVSEGAPPSERPGLICLGRATANTAVALGWSPAAVAAEPSVFGVVEAVHSLVFAVPGPQSSPSKPSSGR